MTHVALLCVIIGKGYTARLRHLAWVGFLATFARGKTCTMAWKLNTVTHTLKHRFFFDRVGKLSGSTCALCRQRCVCRLGGRRVCCVFTCSQLTLHYGGRFDCARQEPQHAAALARSLANRPLTSSKKQGKALRARSTLCCGGPQHIHICY